MCLEVSCGAVAHLCGYLYGTYPPILLTECLNSLFAVLFIGAK